MFRAGITCEWSISRLVRLAGKSTGFSLRVRYFLSRYAGWYCAKIFVMTIENPGRFVITMILYLQKDGRVILVTCSEFG